MTAVVVGGGITGIACASSLQEADVPFVLHERSRALGGRMASRTLRDTGTAFDGRVVDIGASYFTATHVDFVAAIGRLLDRGVVRPWTDAFHVAGPAGIEGVSSGPVRFAAPGGLRSVVVALAEGIAGGQIATESLVGAVTLTDGALAVDDEPASAVALCMPTPQARRISLDVPDDPIPWEPVLAVTCVFDHRSWVELDGVFVNDDAVITWIADDGSRRGDGAPVLVAHVHPVLSARHVADPDAVIPMVVAAIQRVLRIADYPDWVDVHRWSYAKPLASNDAGHWLHDEVPLGLASDVWAGGPRVEAAWLSGRSLGAAIAANANR
jgi:renalase